MASRYLIAEVRPGLHFAYRDVTPPGSTRIIGNVVLVHGFPQTSYQFRHILPLLADHGYRCLAPDYRGAGKSCKPADGFDKATMAEDIVLLLEHLNVEGPVHLVGHDIGGMIAFAAAHRFPKRFNTVTWGECPLPGTSFYRLM